MLNRLFLLPFALGLLGAAAHADNFTITYLGPGVQTPSGITSNYETFTSPTYVGGNLTTTFGGSSVTGTYTGGYSLQAANTYGGAGGTGQYLDVVGPSSYTLTFSAAQSYFGLWFSALDSGNELQFYNGSTLVETFLPSNYSALVGTCPTTAPEPNYCGNPNANFYNQDSTEQFAYLNFYDTSSTFTSVVFTETISGAGFESDNQAIGTAAPVVGTPISATPEPSSLVLLGTGVLGVAGAVRRKLLAS